MTQDEASPPRKRRQTRKRVDAAETPIATPVPPANRDDTARGATQPITSSTEPAGPADAPGAQLGADHTAQQDAAQEPMVVTIFGGTGFVGRRLVAHLVERGARVKIATRRPDDAALPRTTGPGTIEAVKAGIGNDDAVRAAMADATAVVNLVGILHEGGGQTFDSVHVEGAQRVAAAANAVGIKCLVHMSALGASPGSSSAYARSKAGGEQVVHERFPDASVVRPSIVFGPDDNFFNRFAAMAKLSPALPLIGGGTTRFQPVYVEDVAAAIVRMLEDTSAQGKTYELGGPRVYTFKELMELMLRVKGTSRLLVRIPFFLAEIQGSVLQMLPTPPLTRDQVELLKTDNVLGGVAPGLESLGINPTSVEEILPTYL